MTGDPAEPGSQAELGAPAWAGRLLVVGTGLVGTSLGMAVRHAGGTVHLHDRDPDRLALAASLGAGEACPEGDPGPTCGAFDLAIAVVPPQDTAVVCADLLRSAVAAVVSHVASVQAKVQAEVETLISKPDNFVGSHPVAGRETTGPAGADRGLFQGRPWAICAPDFAAPIAVDAVRRLVRATGAVPVELSASEHDELLARVSHVPQLVASALAAGLLDQSAAAPLAGPGFRDMTRLADSPAPMWAEIAAANAPAVAAALDGLIAQLHDVRRQLDGDAAAAVADLIDHGHAGRALLPGKHGRPARLWASVLVVISDEPGSLARLFADIAASEANVEDLRLEHAPGRPRGVLDLAVAPGDRDRLLAALTARGWSAVAGAEAPV
ncbi:MAG: prephenate dehydrogenase [Frankiaceae bacterium]|nr:prephenate dehydrogenase [Frankiaceae bacterium]